MLKYRVHQIFIENLGKYYLPLPKLNPYQLDSLANRFRVNGFKVRIGDRIRASQAERTISVDSSGLAVSNMELLDPIGPAIPTLLEASKSRLARNPYYLMKRRNETTHLQFFTRMESSRTWKELRRSGESGLTPDEHLVVITLLEGSQGSVQACTDYPTSGSKPLQVGRRMYYDSVVDIDEFRSNLRQLGESSGSGRRSCYLPKSSTLRIRRFKQPSRARLSQTFEQLGEWCYLSF